MKWRQNEIQFIISRSDKPTKKLQNIETEIFARKINFML
jgi:hypothetical protein